METADGSPSRIIGQLTRQLLRRPGKAVDTFAGIDQFLNLPIANIDCRDLVAAVAGSICNLIVRSHQHFLWRARDIDDMSNLKGFQIHHGDLVYRRYGNQQPAPVGSRRGSISGTRKRNQALTLFEAVSMTASCGLV